MLEKDTKKALECCGVKKSCIGCPYNGKAFCQDTLCKDALTLINRKNAENEKVRYALKTERAKKKSKEVVNNIYYNIGFDTIVGDEDV
jgi:hypothetical protein